MPEGVEALVDAHGCDPARLRSLEAMQGLFRALVGELGLRPVGEARWHVFPGEGGITGLLLLQESHLALHSFPERGFLALNLYSCRGGLSWDWEQGLKAHVGASRVWLRELPRGS